MRYFLPPTEDPVPRTVGGAARIHAASRADAGPDDITGPADDRLVRVMRMGAGEARTHLARWESETTAHDVPAPPGVSARERSRPDRIHAGALRRQRLALAIAGDVATLAHWSVPEPPTPEDERVWNRVLGRLRAGADGPRAGWTA